MSNASSPRTAAQSERLGPIVDIGFSARGELYLAEKSVGSEYEVHAVTRAGQLRTVIAGAAAARAECVCDVGNCSLCAAAAPGPLAAAQVTFRALSALTLSPEGHLHLADNRALQILTVRPRAPARDSAGHYEVPDTAAREVFTFDKFGQHLATRSLLTGATRHVFEYSKSLGIGKLLKVTDAIGNKLLLHRDYSQRVQFIENTFGQKYSTKLNSLGQLESVQVGQRKEARLEYNLPDDFLLKSVSMTTGEVYSHAYSAVGGLQWAVSPSGEWLQLEEGA